MRLLIFTLLLITLMPNFSWAKCKRAPKWVENPPTSSTAYIGIYMVKKRDFKDRAAYESRAQLQALAKNILSYINSN